MNTIKTFEDLVDYIKANREPTYEELCELCDEHEEWHRLRNDMDFLLTDGERSLIMHYGKPVIIDANADKLKILSANAFATIPGEVWDSLSDASRERMWDNEHIIFFSGEGCLQNEVKMIVPADWREGGIDYEREVALEAIETLKGYLAKYIGDRVEDVIFRREEDVSEYTPDADDIVNYF